MTSSQWLDIAIIGIALIAAISGWRSGALGSLMSFIGVILGAIAGVMLAPHVVGLVSTPRAKLFTALFLILALVVVGEVAGVVLGRAVRSSIRSGPVRVVDSLVGVALQLVVVLVAAWLLGSPLTTSNQTNLAGAAKGSKVISEVDKYAPEWLRAVPKRMSALLSTSGLPDVLEPLRTPAPTVDAPDASLADSLVVGKSRASVVKIRGVATACQKVLEGTGFVIAPNRVMSNAHVVAGSDSVTVEAEDGKKYDATVVSYDPNADISILDVPNLPLPPLQFAEEPAKTGTDAVVLGFPGGGDFVATPARVREIIELSGPDIYKTTTVNREVYTIRGLVRQGNSGGPMINRAGQVIGVVFGAAVDDNDTGFVMTTDEVSRQLAKIGNTAKVPTGACVNG
ncbi:MAG: acid resistance serine protease MarP [Mycobacterium sp.]|nr:acid resistance serine protease MarP [Mycobacterium sp.]